MRPDVRPDLDPSSAPLASERARGTGGTPALHPLERLERALEAARRDPLQPPAALDRARALEELGLRRQAVEAWRRYLALTSGSPLAEQVRRRIGELVESSPRGRWEVERRRLRWTVRGSDQAVRDLVQRFPQAVREHVEEKTFAEWADAEARGDPDVAERALETAERLGAALLTATGDAMASDAAAALRTAGGDDRRREALARGHRLYREGKDAYESYRYADAYPGFLAAAEELRRGGSPFAAWAEYFAGVVERRQRGHEVALARWRRLRPTVVSRYPVLTAHVDWMEGAVASGQGRLGAALSRHRAAFGRLHRARQTAALAQVHFLLAEDLRLLGQPHQAWDHLARALRLHEALRRLSWHVTILENAGETALGLGYPEAAQELASAAVSAARRLPDSPSLLGEALLFRSRLRAHSGLFDLAQRDLAEASGLLPRIPDASFRELVTAQALAGEVQLLGASDPRQAIAAATSAMAKRSQAGAGVVLGDLLLERARALLRLELIDQAEADLLSAIEFHEKGRREVAEERFRISYFDRSREAFDEMIRLQLDRRRAPLAAHRFAERARARALIDALAPVNPGPRTLPPGDLRRRLPEDLAVVQYAMLSDRTVAWVLTRERTAVVQRPFSARVLDAAVARLLRAIARGDRDGYRVHAARLHEELVQPLARLLPAGAEVVFVPDRSLHALPFAALVDAESGRHLVEERAVSVAPSLTLLSASLAREAALARDAARRLLVAGDPAFDRDAFPALPDLPGARAEAESIAGLYAQAHLLLGHEVTEERFLELAATSTIVHFTGHALANQEFPMLSHLVLARTAGPVGDGMLTAREIADTDLRATRLVVLSACRTARSAISPGEGVLGLARAFLAAGVPNVVASLWNVEDRDGEALFEQFHRRYRVGMPAAAALREAQLALLRDPVSGSSDPAVWAAFELIR